MQLPTAGLLIIERRKLLLAYSLRKNCFYLPGGKIEEAETAAHALCREIREELNVELDENDLEYYTHIVAPAYGEKEGTSMEQECFFSKIVVQPTPNAEIGQLKFFSLEDYQMEASQAPGVIMILEKLKADQFID